MRSRRWRSVAIALGLDLALGASVGLLLALSHDAPTAASIARRVAVTLVYATFIGLPAWAFMDWLFGRPRGRPWVRWTVAIASLLAVTVTGAAAAGLVLIAVGWFRPNAFWSTFVFAVRISVVVVVITTVGATLWNRLQRRLDASQVAEARARELAAEARLQALEARVHPHFLFNTLNSVLSLIPAEPARAEELLEKLAGLLRLSLDAGPRRLIPLEDELRIVRDYLDIESARLGDRLRCSIEVDPGLENWPVPPFSLQTLVENGVRHAVAPRRTGGALRIGARRAGERLELSVWDDGPGFSRTELRAGHGLDNLESRLDVLFGGDGRLSLDRAEGG